MPSAPVRPLPARLLPLPPERLAERRARKVWTCECGGWNDRLAAFRWHCGRPHPARSEPGPIDEVVLAQLSKRYEEAADEATLALVPADSRQITPRELRGALREIERLREELTWLYDRERKHEDYSGILLGENAELKRELERLRRLVGPEKGMAASGRERSSIEDWLLSSRDDVQDAQSAIADSDWNEASRRLDDALADLNEAVAAARAGELDGLRAAELLDSVASARDRIEEVPPQLAEVDAHECEDNWPPRYPDPATLKPVPDYVLRPHAYDYYTLLLRGMLLMQAERWVDVHGNELSLAKMPDDYIANLPEFLRNRHADELPELEQTPLIAYLRRRITEAK